MTALRSDAPGFVRRTVDGQALSFPDDATVDVLLESPVLDGRAVASRGIFERFGGIARRAQGLSIALGEERTGEKPWIVYHVVFLADGPCRVLVESQTCFACGLACVTGNPVDYQTFVGVEDPLAALERARARPRVPCPGCGAAFARPAVWVAPA